MTGRAAAGLTVALVFALPAAAAEFPSGRWAFGDTCNAAMDAGSLGAGMVLTPQGILTGISRCEFVQIWPGEDDRWAVMELCSGNDSTWSRISALERAGHDELIHTSEIEGELVFQFCPGTETDYPAVIEVAEPPQAVEEPPQPVEEGATESEAESPVAAPAEGESPNEETRP